MQLYIDDSSTKCREVHRQYMVANKPCEVWKGSDIWGTKKDGSNSWSIFAVCVGMCRLPFCLHFVCAGNFFCVSMKRTSNFEWEGSRTCCWRWHCDVTGKKEQEVSVIMCDVRVVISGGSGWPGRVVRMRKKVKKVKQSLYRSGQVLRIPGGWGSQISRQSAHEGGKVVSPTHQPPLPPSKYSWYSFLLEADSTPGP